MFSVVGVFAAALRMLIIFFGIDHGCKQSGQMAAALFISVVLIGVGWSCQAVCPLPIIISEYASASCDFTSALPVTIPLTRNRMGQRCIDDANLLLAI